MNHKKSYNIDEKLLEKIISVAYGNAGFFDRIIVNRLAKLHPEVKETLEEYKKTAEELHDLEFETCPDEIIQSVEKIIKIDQNKNRSFIFDLGSVFITKPLYSAAAVTIIVLAVLFSAFSDRNFEEPEYTQQEVELATEQVEQALALIGKVFNSAKNTIKEDILAKRVSKPLNESVKSVNDLFAKENKNEKLN